jgi:hypothetical protein
LKTALFWLRNFKSICAMSFKKSALRRSARPQGGSLFLRKNCAKCWLTVKTWWRKPAVEELIPTSGCNKT